MVSQTTCNVNQISFFFFLTCLVISVSIDDTPSPPPKMPTKNIISSSTPVSLQVTNYERMCRQATYPKPTPIAASYTRPSPSKPFLPDLSGDKSEHPAPKLTMKLPEAWHQQEELSPVQSPSLKRLLEEDEDNESQLPPTKAQKTKHALPQNLLLELKSAMSRSSSIPSTPLPKYHKGLQRLDDADSYKYS
jgi:hypothetical protein